MSVDHESEVEALPREQIIAFACRSTNMGALRDQIRATVETWHERRKAVEAERDELRDLLWSVAGQLAGFTEEYRDPDGRDCKVAVAHLIASDIEKYLKGDDDA